MRTPERNTLNQLIEWRPELGVLSVYLDIDPSDRGEAWRVVLRDGLKAIVDAAHEEDPHTLKPAVEAAIERVKQRFPEGAEHPSGRCHIGFVEVTKGKGRETWYAAQVPAKATTIVRQERPFIRPLVELLDDAGAVGVVALSAERVRLFEWKLGQIDEVEDWELSEWRGDWADRKGPSMRDPARGQATSSSGRDQFNQRLGAHRDRFLRETAQQIVTRSSGRDWRELLAFGDEQHARELQAGLGPKRELRHVDGHNLVAEGLQEIATRVESSLEGLNRSRELELVERAKAAVYAEGGRAALGLQETLEALVQGRVEHLLFDAERDYRGAPIDDHLSYGDGTSDSDEPLVAERMIEQAIQTSAKITPLEGEAAAALSEHDGVAALLRY